MSSLQEFVPIALGARDVITPGKVDWTDSPFAWMRHHAPPTKSAMAQRIVCDWLRLRGQGFVELDEKTEPAHLLVGGKKIAIHFALLDNTGHFRYSQLREPGLGVDLMLMLGIEPRRVRMWICRPVSVGHLPTYRESARGLHSLSFDPEDVPDYLVEVGRWS